MIIVGWPATRAATHTSRHDTQRAINNTTRGRAYPGSRGRRAATASGIQPHSLDLRNGHSELLQKIRLWHAQLLAVVYESVTILDNINISVK
jgi:hypothetical protein